MQILGWEIFADLHGNDCITLSDFSCVYDSCTLGEIFSFCKTMTGNGIILFRAKFEIKDLWLALSYFK